MLSLANQDAVRAVLFGDDGAAAALPEGAYIVDMSTIPPGFARELAEIAPQSGHRALDACVYGAPMHARSGELRVMVGADEPDFHALEGILGKIGKEVTYLGPNGMGATMKLVLNMLMGVQMPALAEAIVFGERAGLRREDILNMIQGSGYSSPVMNFRCNFIGQREGGLQALADVKGHDARTGREPGAQRAHAWRGERLRDPHGRPAARPRRPRRGDGRRVMERMAGMDAYPWPAPSGDGAPKSGL